jgi:ribosomal protein S18 acetylase RimI-like enzyme
MDLRTPSHADAGAILALLVARDVADIGRADCTLDDVTADLESPHADVWVAEDGGEIAGYAVLGDRGAMVSVHPEREGRGAGTLLRLAAEARAGERGLEVAQGVMASNEAARAHLRAAGYERGSEHLRLRGPVATDAAMDARVGRFDLDADGPAAHAVLQDGMVELGAATARPYDAWHEHVARASEPAFRLAVRDAAGLAGAVVGERWEEGVGYVAELAVDRRARGQGLGRALVVALLAAFAEAGLGIAELSVRAENTTALALYASVGLVEDFRQEGWART